jgi:hypothetical protein
MAIACLRHYAVSPDLFVDKQPKGWSKVSLTLVCTLQDCLLLLVNLLLDNPANQLMFRESGYLANVHLLLELPSASPSGGLAHAASVIEAHLAGPEVPGISAPVSPEVAANLTQSMDLLAALLTPVSSAALAPERCGGAEASRSKAEMGTVCLEANHALVAKTDVCEKLLEIALFPGHSTACTLRCRALQVLLLIVKGRQSAQDALGNAVVSWRDRRVPCLQV